jgi:hypothetical protein
MAGPASGEGRIAMSCQGETTAAAAAAEEEEEELWSLSFFR